jgi:hypothetical protein
MPDELKSPTCRECARARGLRVPGDVHTVWEGVCANCGAVTAVAPASDWRPVGTRHDPRTMD